VQLCTQLRLGKDSKQSRYYRVTENRLVNDIDTELAYVRYSFAFRAKEQNVPNQIESKSLLLLLLLFPEQVYLHPESIRVSIDVIEIEMTNIYDRR